jgi:hypothetical protein
MKIFILLKIPCIDWLSTLDIGEAGRRREPTYEGGGDKVSMRQLSLSDVNNAII